MRDPRYNRFIRYQLVAYRDWMDSMEMRCHLLVNLKDATPLLREQAVMTEYGSDVGVLTIGSTATRNFVADDNGITFDCRKKGVNMTVTVPYEVMYGVRDPEVGLVYQLDCSGVYLPDGNPGLMIHAPVIGPEEQPPEELKAPKERPKLTLVK